MNTNQNLASVSPEHFDPQAYLNPVVEVLESVLTDRGYNFGMIREQYEDGFFANIYDESLIAGDLAAQQVAKENPRAEQSKLFPFSEYIEDVLRASAVVEVDRPGYQRLSLLNDPQREAVVREIAKIVGLV